MVWSYEKFRRYFNSLHVYDMSMTDKACCKSGSHPFLEQTSTWPLKGFKLMPEMIKGPACYSLHHTLPHLRRIILKVQQFKFDLSFIIKHTGIYILLSMKWKKFSLSVFLLLQRVLTAEYIDGCKVSDVEGIKKMGLSLHDVSIQMCTNNMCLIM